jgi:hypothetical protein
MTGWLHYLRSDLARAFAAVAMLAHVLIAMPLAAEQAASAGSAIGHGSVCRPSALRPADAPAGPASPATGHDLCCIALCLGTAAAPIPADDAGAGLSGDRADRGIRAGSTMVDREVSSAGALTANRPRGPPSI